MISPISPKSVADFANTLRSATQRYALLLGNGFTLDLFGREESFTSKGKDARQSIGKEKSWRKLLEKIVKIGQKECQSNGDATLKGLLANKSLTDTEIGMLIKDNYFNNDEALFSKAMGTAVNNIYNYKWYDNYCKCTIRFRFNCKFGSTGKRSTEWYW